MPEPWVPSSVQPVTRSAPLTTTGCVFAGSGAKTIGDPELPSLPFRFTVSRYVPARMYTVSPAATTFAARWMVRKGAADDPEWASSPPVAT